MEELYNEGRIKAIGVSNFNVHHINQLMKDGEVKPMVNQVECHVQLQNNFLYEFCMQHDIFLQAYSPLMSSEFEKIINNEQLAEIGKP
jgi:diketogulonate reductase-like aldo/keto reductase